MKRFAGLDVSLSTTAIWVVDDQGQLVFEGSVATDPDTGPSLPRAEPDDRISKDLGEGGVK